MHIEILLILWVGPLVSLRIYATLIIPLVDASAKAIETTSSIPDLFSESLSFFPRLY